jgi:hypothetical protein
VLASMVAPGVTQTVQTRNLAHKQKLRPPTRLSVAVG